MPFPYTFPFAFDSGYFVEVDWSNNSNFTDTYDDVTVDCRSAKFSRGKDSEGGKAQIGSLTVVLNNDSQIYSPEYSSGGLYGNLLPRRTIQLYYSSAGTDYPLFYGFVEEIIPRPHISRQDAVITAIDGLDFLARHDLDTALYKDELTGTLVGNILDSASWSATLRTIDAGQDTVPYAYWHDVKARYALGEIEDSELGFIYINGSGYLCFEDRHHRYSATHQTSQATFTDTMVEVPYNYGAKKVYNEVVVTVTPWELQSIAELWRLEEEPVIPAGESSTFWGQASVSGESVFVDAWTSPVATTDYQAWTGASGTGTDKTADLTVTPTKFAKSIKLVVANGASVPVYLYLLKARGTYYDDKTKVTRKSEDSTSQTAYQKRTLRLDGKFMTDVDTAQDYCDYSIIRYKDPQAEVGMSLINKSSTILTQILSREISDRVTVANTELGLNKDFFIDWMEHDITEAGKLHKVRYRLADASNEDFWCLDYSELGTGTKLGY